MFVGYRGWKIRKISGKLTLESPSSSFKDGDRFFWKPGENVARCELGCTDIPGDDCYCGIYCLQNPEPDLVNYEPDIVGQVFLYGDKILEGTIGYRASHAMISLFLIPSVEPLAVEQLEELSMRYRVPLVKARGDILRAISTARRKLLMGRGELEYVRHNEMMEQSYAWMNKRVYNPRESYPRRFE